MNSLLRRINWCSYQLTSNDITNFQEFDFQTCIDIVRIPKYRFHVDLLLYHMV